MKLFTFGALATAALCATARATDTTWSGLDQEISSLSASLATEATSGPKVGGYIIAAFDYEADPPSGDPDTAGWDFRFVRAEIKGDLGHDYSYKVSFDFAADSEDSDLPAALQDAFVDWKITEGIQARWGRYRTPFARSALISDAKLLFLQRTRIADALSARELGASISGQFEMVRFWLNVQNGEDGTGKELFVNGRLTFDIMGEGVSMIEGAYGASDTIGMTFGGAFGDDGSLDDGGRWILEAAFVSGPFSIAAEIADFDDSFTDPTGGGELAGSTPWDFTVSFLFTEQYEIAARYEDYEDGDDDGNGEDDNTTAYTLGLNRYVAGHDIKWTLQYQRIDTDKEVDGIAFDRDLVSIGLTVAF